MIRLTLDEIFEATAGRCRVRAPAAAAIQGVSIDSRTVRQGDLFVAVRGERFDGHDYVSEALERGAAYAVVAHEQAHRRNYPVDRTILVSETVDALGRLAAYHRTRLSATVIAVTGSNGKTTTKAMISHVLSAALRGRAAMKSYNNRIGVPLTLLAADAADEFLVVEIGTNAPGEINQLAALVKPDIAVLTSVSPAHLEGLGDLDGVIREKLALLGHVCNGGMAVVNIDEPRILEYLPRCASYKLVTIGFSQSADIRAAALTTENAGTQFRINDRFAVRLTVLGRHNACNALCAYSVGRRLGMAIEEITSRLSTFELPAMRLETHQYGSVLVLNDAYNANPASMNAALQVLDTMEVSGRRVAILGDMRELGDQAQTFHEALGRTVAASRIDVVIAVGQHAEALTVTAHRASNGRLETHVANSSQELADKLPTLIKPCDTVLLKGSRASHLEALLPALAHPPTAVTRST